MATDVEPVVRCPVCGASEQEEVLRETDSLFPTGVLRLVRCGSCGIVLLNPRLTRDAMITLENASPVYELDDGELEAEVTARIALLKSLPTKTSRVRMLDIGCNRGLLLLAASSLGWEPVGVEVSPVAASKAREASGAPVYPDLMSVPAGDGFDLVVAWHVLEHTADPKTFLKQARGLLSPGGVLALQVPSYDFVSSFRQEGRLASIVCAVHNFYFTEATMDETLRRAGFEQRTLINSSLDLMLTAFAELRPRSRTSVRRLRWAYAARRARAKLSRGGR